MEEYNLWLVVLSRHCLAIQKGLKSAQHTHLGGLNLCCKSEKKSFPLHLFSFFEFLKNPTFVNNHQSCETDHDKEMAQARSFIVQTYLHSIILGKEWPSLIENHHITPHCSVYCIVYLKEMRLDFSRQADALCEAVKLTVCVSHATYMLCLNQSPGRIRLIDWRKSGH